MSTAPDPSAQTHFHGVQFYDDDAFLVGAVAKYLGEGFALGDGAVVIATEPHRQALTERLRRDGIDVGAMVERGALVLCDAQETLDRFMAGGLPDSGRFDLTIPPVLAKASAASSTGLVRAYGEMVDLLWKAGNPRGTVALEQRWNELQQGSETRFTLLCGYSMANFTTVADADAFEQICGTHAQVEPAETFPRHAEIDRRLREVSILQQRTRALETEVRHRRELEAALREALTERRAAQQELQDFVENAVMPLHWVGADGTILWANAAELAMLGWSKDEYIGRNIVDFHADRAAIEDILARLKRNESLQAFPAKLRCKDGSIRDVLIDSNVQWKEGRFLHTCCFTRDVTAEYESRGIAEKAVRRTRFLSDASAALSASLDYEAALSEVAKLASRSVAEGCIVQLVAEGSVTPFLSVEHADDRCRSALTEYCRLAPLDLAASRGLGWVIRTGTPEIFQIDDDLPEQAVVDLGARRLLRDAGIRAAIALPIIARGRTYGAIAMLSSGDRRSFAPEDLEMALELGRRVGLAIDNARLYREARSADRRKDEFLAMLGHELRNPLAPILTALQLMQLRGVGGEREQKVIGRQVRHLVRLVDDLLDVSRITRGKVALKKEPIEIAAALAKAIEIASPLFEQRSHSLAVEAPREGMLVEADPVRVSQVLANLLTNAAKYTDAGGSITVTARRQDEWVEVAVRDSGIGIHAEMLPRIFDLFVQGDRALDRSQGGLGIGLTLARSLVELHGGTIHAASDGPGRGSEFTIRLRALTTIPAAATAPAPKGRAFGRSVKRTGLRVLVVDDNVDAAEMLADALRGFGHDVGVAHDGPQGLEVARELRPDVALLDIGLPVMDGYELAKKLRDAFGSRLKLLAVTGYGQDADRERSREAGFDVHLVKPVDLEAVAPLLTGSR